MATSKSTKPVAPAAKPAAPEPRWQPTAEAKGNANRLRVIALAMWVVAIALEVVAIFWVLRPTADQMAAAHGFPQSRWYLLIGFLVVIAALSIIGSQLWKKANHLDPASKDEPVRFFVQNQLGAIIALIAFVPLIVLIFLDKNMNGQQKGIAGGIGIVLVIVAAIAGIDFNPISQQQQWVESQVITQIRPDHQDLVYWTASGTVMHLCAEASDIKNSANVQSGTVAEAFGSSNKMQGITLKLDQEFTQCAAAGASGSADAAVFAGATPPDNMSDLIAWVQDTRAARAGSSVTQPSDSPS